MAASPVVLYVFDAYCGWCYGFEPVLAEVWRTHGARVPFQVVSGGLFVGYGRYPVSTYPFITEANRRIVQLTGATFGAGYERVLAEGSMVLDSEAAAAGFAALRAQAPARAVELAFAQQQAFFVDGKSLSDVATYRAIAESHGLDAERVVAFLEGPEGAVAAHADFALARSHNVTGFPALLVVNGARSVRLPGVGSPASVIGQQLLAALDAPRAG